MAKKTVAKEFILAAERHKYTCEKILELSDFNNCQPDEHGNYPSVELNQKQKHLLSNVYYLSGYIIECSCCAAIYSYFPKLARKKDLAPTERDKHYRLRNVSFQSDDSLIFSVCGRGKTNHSLMHFTEFPSFFDNSAPRVPLLNGDISKFSSSNDLLSSFQAEIRYVCNKDSRTNFYENVCNFYKVAMEIYQGVITTYKILP